MNATELKEISDGVQLLVDRVDLLEHDAAPDVANQLRAIARIADTLKATAKRMEERERERERNWRADDVVTLTPAARQCVEQE